MGADLADMQLISKFNKGFRFKLCVSTYAWVILLKDKNFLSIVNAFQKNKKKSVGKPNKICVDKVSEVYNSHFKKWLKDKKCIQHIMKENLLLLRDLLEL